ncbi:hypothetical protein BpHYR1_001713 [Brachionus plicatilis]|uniref:Uncharacterized protein n=1 Tax=Brachionus plicatilis TaxID=10195 RepID=A0A3M7T018_BRAPC|nr:hypothetical protein BpHYR1_001713 [Brachionus plicatilis]
MIILKQDQTKRIARKEVNNFIDNCLTNQVANVWKSFPQDINVAIKRVGNRFQNGTGLVNRFPTPNLE